MTEAKKTTRASRTRVQDSPIDWTVKFGRYNSKGHAHGHIGFDREQTSYLREQKITHFEVSDPTTYWFALKGIHIPEGELVPPVTYKVQYKSNGTSCVTPGDVGPVSLILERLGVREMTLTPTSVDLFPKSNTIRVHKPATRKPIDRDE